MAIFISTNSSTGGELANELPKTILTKYFAAARIKPTTIDLGPETLKDYQGTYLGDRLSSSIAERFFLALVAKTVKVDVGTGALAINGLRVAAIGPDVFTTEGGELLAFHRDDAGRVSELKTVVESFRRLPPWRTPLFLAVICGLTVLLSVVNLVMGWRHLRPGNNERRTWKLFLGASLGWLLFVACIVGAIVQMTRSPLETVFLYPPDYRHVDRCLHCDSQHRCHGQRVAIHGVIHLAPTHPVHGIHYSVGDADAGALRLAIAWRLGLAVGNFSNRMVGAH